MIARPGRQTTTLSGPGKKPLLEQVRFNHVLEGGRVIAHRRGDRLESDRPATVGVEDRPQVLAVELVEPFPIDTFESERLLDDLRRDLALRPDLCEVPNPPEQSPGDARGSTAS